MGKKRERHQNPEPFLTDDTNKSVSKKRNKPAKQHQSEEKLISAGMSSKILKEALIQQKEIQEETDAQNPNNIVFPEEPVTQAQVDEDDDVDNFAGFSDNHSQFGGCEEEINEDEEKLLEAFFSKDARPQRTLADVIVEKIKEKDTASSGLSAVTQPLPKLDDSIIEIYKSVGEIFKKYTSGKLPLAFKSIPAKQHWEELLYLTEPEKWSPNAMYQATRILASNMSSKKVERFYKFVLLPRIRQDIRKNKKLHFALYQALKKAVYKPAAFNKGILFPICESRTCNLREAVIIGSILQKVSIPPLHSSLALMKLAEMEYGGTTSYFIKLLVEKKYALPYRVVDAMVAHFMRFCEDSRDMPVIWHQSLLAFMQRYKHELTKDQKDELNYLVKKQRHKMVTPEILRELHNSRNRGEKEDDLMSISSPISVINKTIEEDRFDIPDVPMEED
ncbi:bystin [Cynara cardunculus var. scolymus]|uniref:bystin n=1 Tax=Cynara cardunculus var. scolymus TaxID=59895 RepID=UPI000D62E26B|nr:bystin [Cynara cardunculus var. scolymus]